MCFIVLPVCPWTADSGSMSGLRDTACQTASRIEVGLQLCGDWSKPPLRYVECRKKNIKRYICDCLYNTHKGEVILHYSARWKIWSGCFIWKTEKLVRCSLFPTYCFVCLMLFRCRFFGNKRSRVAQSIHDEAGFKMTYGGIMVESCDVTPQEFPLVTRMTTPSYFWLQNEWLIIDSMLCCPSGRHFRNQWQKVPPNGGSKDGRFSLRRCSHPWERSSRCGRSWSYFKGVVNAGVSVADVKIQHIHNGLKAWTPALRQSHNNHQCDWETGSYLLVLIFTIGC